MNRTTFQVFLTCFFLTLGVSSFAKMPTPTKNARIMGPTVNLGADKSVCTGTTITLDAGNAGASYAWSMGGAATQTRTVTSAVAGIISYSVAVTVSTGPNAGTTNDTIRIEFLAPPAAPTTTNVNTCQGNINLMASAGANNQIGWFTAASGGTFLGFGSPLLYNATVTTTVYAQAWNQGTLGTNIGPTLGNGTSNSLKGIKFDVLSPIILGSVIMQATTQGSPTIVLKNSSNQVLRTWIVPLQGNFPTTVSLNFPIYTGTGYSLSVTNMGTCTSLRIYDSGGPDIYPMTLPNLLQVKEWSATDTGKYYYFLPAQIKSLGCSGPTSPLAVTVLSTPNVAFGIDTVACNASSVVLSMPAGGTYLWSTGATTQSITVNSPGGMIIGENSLATGCSDKDTINVLFSTTPTTPTVNNITTCVGNVSLSASSSANSKIVWRDGNASNSGYVGSGSPLIYNAAATTTLYAESYNVSNAINFSYAYLPGINTTTNITSPKGLTFDVIRPIILDSVTIHPKYSGQAYIEVQKSNGTVVARKLVSFNPATPHAPVRVGLGFTILPGTGQKLLFYLNESSASTNALKAHSAVFPQQIAGYVKITTSTNGASTYVGFYDWEVRLLTCPTGKVPLVVTVNPTPTLNLGRDTAQCGGTIALTMGAGNSSASPTWKNLSGTTLGTGINLTVNTSNDGTIIGEAILGTCVKRDTINAEILATPNAPTVPTPPTACAGTVTLTANAGGNQVLWWDAATSGNVIGSGSPFTYTTAAGNCSATTTTTLYAQSYSTSSFRRSVGLKTPGTTYTSAAGTGYRFDVNAGVTIKLDSVTIYAASSGAFVLELYNAAGTLLQVKTINNIVGNANAQQIYVGFIIYSGTDYIFKVKNSSTFNLWSIAGAANANYYPLTIPGFLTIKSGVHSTLGNNVLNRYYSLYDWKVTIYPCGSATRTPVVISTLPTPNVNLGTDQITCGSAVTLNAGACTGATFSWMNNTTAQTLTISSPGITTAAVIVSKTTAGTTCTDRDTAKIDIISSPVLAAMPSVTHCGGNVVLTDIETVPADTVLWWNAATNGNVLAVGSPTNYYFTNSQTVYAQGYNLADINLDLGPTTPNLVTSSNILNRGIKFNVKTPMWIEYVTVYTQSAGTLNIELVNPNGTVTQQKFVATQASYAPSQVKLGFFVVPGNGYKLRLSATSAGYLYSDITSAPFYSQSNMQVIDGAGTQDISLLSSFDGNTTLQTYYYYFYDWKVRVYRCPSARVSKTVTILPTPINTLPNDTISCGGSVTMCSPSPGAVLAWTISPANAGTVNASCVTINSSATVILTSTYTSVNCSDIDTVQVEISSTPSQLTANDVSVCPGEATVIATSNADYVAWFDAPTGGNLVTFGDTATFYAIYDTVLYVQGYNITHFAQSVGQANWTLNAGNMSNTTARGLIFDVYKPIIIDTVSIYLNTNAPSGSITIAMLDKDLNIIATKVFNNWNVQTIGGKYLQKVPLGFFASPNPYGSYRLVLKTNTLSILAPSDNELAFEPTSAFPFNIPNALYITAGNNSNNTPNLNTYYYFFDWKVRFGACQTATQSVNVTVYPVPDPITGALGPDFTICGDTILNPGSFPTGYTYEWNTIPPVYTQALPITQSGTYIVTVYNLNGCGASDDINANVNPLPLAAGTVTVGANNVITYNANGSSSGTLAWTFGGGATSALAFGNYTYPATPPPLCNQTVTLTVQNSCGTDVITIPVNLCVAIDEGFAQQISVFPNPTDGLLHIQLKEANSNSLSIRLTDMLGREILAKKVDIVGNDLDTELNLQQVAAGMYQLILTTPDNKTAVKRVVVNP